MLKINDFLFIIPLLPLIYYNFVPYPKWVIYNFNEPIYKFICYLCIYFISYYDIRTALVSLILILLLHLDYINLISDSS
jgi:hypothetical protein